MYIQQALFLLPPMKRSPANSTSVCKKTRAQTHLLPTQGRPLPRLRVQTALNHPAARPSGLPLPWGNPPPWSPHHPHCLPLPPPLPSRTAGCRTHLAGPGGLYVTSRFKASCRRTPGTARAPRAPTRTPAGPVPTHLLCGSCNDIPFGESQGPCLEPPTWLFFVALLPPLTNLLSLFFKTLSS